MSVRYTPLSLFRWREGMGPSNSSHMSEKRCSDKNFLFAMRFKTHAAKTTSVFRSSAFMPTLRRRKKKCFWYNQKQNNLWFLESSAKQGFHKHESLLLRKKKGKEKYFQDVKLHLHFDFWYGFHWKKIIPGAWSQKNWFYIWFFNEHGFSAVPGHFYFLSTKTYSSALLYFTVV